VAGSRPARRLAGAWTLDGPLPALGTVEGACDDRPRFWVRGWSVNSAPDALVM